MFRTTTTGTAKRLSSSAILSVVCVAVVLWVVSGCGTGTPSASSGGTPVVLGPRPVGGNATPADEAEADGVQVVEEPSDLEPTEDVEEASDPSEPADEDEVDNGPIVDGCEAVSGRTFYSSNGSLSLLFGEFIWTESGGQVTGTYACDGLDLVGRSTAGEQIAGSYDPTPDIVYWGGLIYRPTRPF